MTAILDTIVADIEAAWHTVEVGAETLAVEAWDLFKHTVTVFAPAELAKLQGLVAQVIADVEKGDLAALETAVLNAAEHAGEDFLQAVESNVIQPIIGIIAGKLGWAAAA